MSRYPPGAGHVAGKRHVALIIGGYMKKKQIEVANKYKKLVEKYHQKFLRAVNREEKRIRKALI